MLLQKFSKSLIMGSVIVSSCILTISMLSLLVAISTAWDLHHDIESKTNSSQKNFEPRFTRYENIFNDENNASLYVGSPFSRRSGDVKDELKPANETTGRALDLEALFGESSSDSQTGDRESRIVNEKPKINIQGFIPIITVDKSQRGHVQNQQPQPVYSPSSSQDSFESQPVFSQNNPSYGYAGPEHGKQAFGGIGAALQNLAVFRPLKRKFGSPGYPQEQLTPGVDCLCVPFYMCKRGFLESSTAKNSFGNPNQQQQPSEEFIRRQFTAAQSEATSNFASASLPSNNFFNQDSSPGSNLPQPSSSQPEASYDMNMPVDERSIDHDSERSINFNDTQQVSNNNIFTLIVTNFFIVVFKRRTRTHDRWFWIVLWCT